MGAGGKTSATNYFNTVSTTEKLLVTLRSINECIKLTNVSLMDKAATFFKACVRYFL